MLTSNPPDGPVEEEQGAAAVQVALWPDLSVQNAPARGESKAA